MAATRDTMSVLVGTGDGIFGLGDGAPSCLLATGGMAGFAVRGRRIAAALGVSGIAISRDAGANWEMKAAAGLAPVSITFDPNEPGRLYAGTRPAGLLTSGDDGQSWQVLQDFRALPGTELWEIPELDPSKPVTSQATGEGAATCTVRADPHRPGRIVAGVEVGGLVISDDAGESWRISPVGDSPDPHDIVIHPEDRDVIVVSTGYSRFTDTVGAFAYSPTGGVYRSTDAGRSFRNVWPNAEDPQYTRLMCCDAGAPHAITVCCRSSYVQPNNPTGERRADLRQSRDKGLSWRTLGSGEFACFAEEYSAVTADPIGPGNVYVGTEKGRLFHVDAATRDWREIARFASRINCLATVGGDGGAGA